MSVFLYSLIVLALCIAFFIFGFFVGGHMGIRAFRRQYDNRLEVLIKNLKELEMKEINRNLDQFKKDLSSTKFLQ